MRKLLYIFTILMLSLLAVASGCAHKEDRGGACDSMLTGEYISGIAISEPERALALIDTAEQKGLWTDFDINRLRALVYHNGLTDDIKALEYAMKAYDSPGARKDTRKYLRLIEMIAGLSYQNGDYPQSVGFCTEGIKIAQDSMIRDSEANLDFHLGRNLFMLNRDDEGFQYYTKAVDILDGESKKSRTFETADDYVYRVAITIGTLVNHGYYDEAVAWLPRYEEAVARLESKANIPDGLVDMRRASGYSMAAHLYAIKGDRDKADKEYRKLCATDYAGTPDAGQLIIPYLYQIGDYSGALRHLMEEKKYWQANIDTVSYSYIQNHLESELAVYEKLGDIRAANRVLHTITMLKDSLRERDSNEKALELAEIYKTHEQALQIERQSASITVRNVIIVSAVIFLLFAIIFIFRILRSNKIIKNKNRAMVKTIDELMGYKDELFESQEEIIQLRA